MRLVVLIMVMNVLLSDIDKIAKINRIKRTAEKAYANGDINSAISSFRLLTDSLGVKEDPVLLNLANAYFQQNDTSNAVQFYSRVLSSDDANIRSRAYQQMGIINKQQNKLDQSMANFKTALKADPNNEDARYNYELLKKIMDEQKQQQENKDKDIEPSEYAKRLKARADQLVKQFLFEQALGIMQKGLQEDETVAAYNEFITKLNDVVESKE